LVDAEFVHAEDVRFYHERARQLGALQHAARQLVRVARLEALVRP
jgi:hypothetical protein